MFENGLYAESNDIKISSRIVSRHIDLSMYLVVDYELIITMRIISLSTIKELLLRTSKEYN